MQIAEPARNEGRVRQFDGPFEMFGRSCVVLLLPLQIAEATENIGSLASSLIVLISADPTDDALERVLDSSDDEVKIAAQENDVQFD
jgi:hypothetical protein